MWILENKIIPLPGWSVIMIFGILFTRDKAKITARRMRHEKIHIRQWIEITLLCAVILTALHFFTGLSLWWLLTAIIAYYAVYGLCWLIELCLPPYNRAYGNICMEAEAYYNAGDETYLSRRIPFSFLKYISNKRYPYESNRSV